MADFTRPIPPVMPGEFPSADWDAPAGRHRGGESGRRPAVKPPAEPRPEESPGEAADPDPRHQLDESA